MVEHLYSILIWHYLGKKYFPNYQPWVTVKHLIGRKSIIKQFFRLPKHEINNNITLDMISLEDSYIEQSSNILESRALKLQNYSFVWQMQRVWQYFINYLFYRLNNQRCFIHAVIFLPKNSKMSLCPTNKQYCSYHDVVYYSFLTLLTTIILPSAVTMDTVPEVLIKDG